jgi:hypothetical protein
VSKQGCLRWAANRDANDKEIVAALRKVGASVQDLCRVGGGCPDKLIGFRGQNKVAEIKVPGKKSKPNQAQWSDKWKGEKPGVLETVEDALRFLGVNDEKQK